MTLKLEKTIDIHYGRCPIKVDSELAQSSYFHKDMFWLLYADDLPADLHDKTTESMKKNLGVDTDYHKRTGHYILPFIIDKDGMITSPSELQDFVNSDFSVSVLKDTSYRTGGFAASERTVFDLVKALEDQGYKIIKQYE